MYMPSQKHSPLTPVSILRARQFKRLFFIMRSNLVLIALSLLCRFAHTSALPARELEQRDLVHDVVLLLELLHASSFCSSFAPQTTVVVPATATTSQTMTTSTTTTNTIVVCREIESKSIILIHHRFQILPLLLPPWSFQQQLSWILQKQI